jgi:hypothetical protein
MVILGCKNNKGFLIKVCLKKQFPLIFAALNSGFIHEARIGSSVG